MTWRNKTKAQLEVNISAFLLGEGRSEGEALQEGRGPGSQETDTCYGQLGARRVRPHGEELQGQMHSAEGRAEQAWLVSLSKSLTSGAAPRQREAGPSKAPSEAEASGAGKTM